MPYSVSKFYYDNYFNIQIFDEYVFQAKHPCQSVPYIYFADETTNSWNLTVLGSQTAIHAVKE